MKIIVVKLICTLHICYSRRRVSHSHSFSYSYAVFRDIELCKLWICKADAWNMLTEHGMLKWNKTNYCYKRCSLHVHCRFSYSPLQFAVSHAYSRTHSLAHPQRKNYTSAIPFWKKIRKNFLRWYFFPCTGRFWPETDESAF